MNLVLGLADEQLSSVFGDYFMARWERTFLFFSTKRKEPRICSWVDGLGMDSEEDTVNGVLWDK